MILQAGAIPRFMYQQTKAQMPEKKKMVEGTQEKTFGEILKETTKSLNGTAKY